MHFFLISTCMILIKIVDTRGISGMPNVFSLPRGKHQPRRDNSQSAEVSISP